MEISSYEKSGVIVIVPEGRLDAQFAEALRAEFLKHIATHRRFVLDCHGLDYLDSTGLGVMVFCLKSSNEYGGDLKLACVTESARMILEITRAYKIFDIYDTLDAAIEALNQK